MEAESDSRAGLDKTGVMAQWCKTRMPLKRSWQKQNKSRTFVQTFRIVCVLLLDDNYRLVKTVRWHLVASRAKRWCP